MKAWNRMLRIPNLIMILFIQLSIYVFFIHPNFPIDELPLSYFQFILFLISLLCIASSGYVVNNIYDINIDSLETSHKIIPDYFTLKFSWQLYSVLVLTGFMSALYLSYSTGFYKSLILYPLTVGILWLYSVKLKCFPLAGNILISVLTGFVIAIIPYIFWDNLKDLRISDYSTWATLMYRFIMLIIFAILTNLAREIIKDIEDVDADRTFNCNSTATYFGIKTSNFIALNVWFALLIICGSALWYTNGLLPRLWFIFMIGIPSIIIFIFLIKAEVTKDFSRLSLFIKLFMILGAFYWCVLGS